MVLFCLLQGTHLASAGCAALKIGGCQHVEQASWNLTQLMRAPRPPTSPVLVVDGHPLTKRQQGAGICQHAHDQANEGTTCTRNESTEHQAHHIPTHHRGKAGCCAA
ncbi:hypothetical protein TRVL_08346 [Trypanosoma vivax]|nr:hypothetical protein TRVL_08346 [Trypanosoma vivax]